MIHPQYFIFDHDGIDTTKYTIRVKDAVSGDQYVGADVGIGSIPVNGQTRTVDIAANALGVPQVPLLTDVIFTVQAGNTLGEASAVATSPVFQFQNTLSTPTNLTTA